jgi:PAS domain S-box-containing protein
MKDDIVVLRPDGQRVPLVTWAAPLSLAGQGPPDAAVWVLEDLTTVKRAEAAYREGERRVRALLDALDEGLVVQEAGGAVAECNAAACALLGLPAEELRGRRSLAPDWKCLREDGTPFPAEDQPPAVCLRTGRPVRDVTLGLQGAGVRWLRVTSVPLEVATATGLPGRVATTLADVTAARAALEGLRASQEKYRGLVETLPLLVAQSTPDLHLTYLNPAGRAMSGFDLEDVQRPEAWQALVHPDDLPGLLGQVREALAGRPGRCEVRFRSRDGAERLVLALLQPRWEGASVAGLTTLALDVTRERLLEQELQRAQRGEMVARLAGGRVHDLNNLLTAVLAASELLAAKLGPGHAARPELACVEQAAQRAVDLAGQLKAFNKQYRRESRRVDLNEVVRHTLELLRGQLPEAVRVEADLSPAAPAVQGDAVQLQQVLTNLCLNARDAMPRGGRLRVETAEADGDWVRLAVQDDGEGVAEAARPRLFEPFFSTRERGTGLGLAVVHQVVQSHGGRVEVHSRPGEGARFEVWLPSA